MRLPRDYASALATIDSRLQYWPFWQVHKCKQRLTRLTQVALRTRRLAKEQERLGETLVPRMAPKVKRREEGRERKALAAAKVERAIERELVERLRSGAYGDRPLNAEEGVWKKVLRALERSGEGERDEDLDEGIENEEEEEEEEELEEDGEREMEREWEVESDVEVNGVGDVEYVSDVDESDEDDHLGEGQDIEDLGELEDWLGGQSEEDDVDDYDDDDDEDEGQSISSKLDFKSEDDAQEVEDQDDDSDGDDDHRHDHHHLNDKNNVVPDNTVDKYVNGKTHNSIKKTTTEITNTPTNLAAAAAKPVTSPLKRKRSDILLPSSSQRPASKTITDVIPKSPPLKAKSTITTSDSMKTTKKSNPNRTGIGIGIGIGHGHGTDNGTTSTSIATATSTATSGVKNAQNQSKRKRMINKGPARPIEYEYEYEYEVEGKGKGEAGKDIVPPGTRTTGSKSKMESKTEAKTKMKMRRNGGW